MHPKRLSNRFCLFMYINTNNILPANNIRLKTDCGFVNQSTNMFVINKFNTSRCEKYFYVDHLNIYEYTSIYNRWLNIYQQHMSKDYG